MTRHRATTLASVVLFAALAAACRPVAVDTAVHATVEAPDAPRGELGRIPYDPSRPYYVVTIEPFTFGTDGAAAPSTSPGPGLRYGWGPSGWGWVPEAPRAWTPPSADASGRMGNAIAGQLMATMGYAGNIRLLDYEYYWERRDKPASLARRNGGELGPFVVRGAVTEFNEIAEATGGGVVAVANRKSNRTMARRTGSVALDLQIIDPATGRIADTVQANGRFTTDSTDDGFSLFDFGKTSRGFAASALGQANRIAVSSATQQLCERLRKMR